MDIDSLASLSHLSRPPVRSQGKLEFAINALREKDATIASLERRIQGASQDSLQGELNSDLRTEIQELKAANKALKDRLAVGCQ